VQFQVYEDIDPEHENVPARVLLVILIPKFRGDVCPSFLCPSTKLIEERLEAAIKKAKRLEPKQKMNPAKAAPHLSAASFLVKKYVAVKATRI